MKQTYKIGHNLGLYRINRHQRTVAQHHQAGCNAINRDRERGQRPLTLTPNRDLLIRPSLNLEGFRVIFSLNLKPNIDTK